MNTNFKIGDNVQALNGSFVRLEVGDIIQGGDIAYPAIPLDEKYNGWGKFCLLEKDLTPVK